MAKKSVSIILTSSSKLGKIRDKIDVARGFARHYLFPRQKARLASEAVIKELEERKVSDDRRDQDRRDGLVRHQQKLEGVFVGFVRAASEKGHLYGSVTAKDIVDNLNNQGFHGLSVDMVVMPTPLKMLGQHLIRLVLDEGISCTINLVASRSQEELDEDRQSFSKTL